MRFQMSLMFLGYMCKPLFFFRMYTFNILNFFHLVPTTVCDLTWWKIKEEIEQGWEWDRLNLNEIYFIKIHFSF